ncbi:MAG: hypothetical protein ACRDJH_02650 [Thermomicrobiales bacterium]
MARLAPMPPIEIPEDELLLFGQTWTERGGRLSRTPPYSSGELGLVFDRAVGRALATLLGGLAIVAPSSGSLIPPQRDCVEVGPVRIIGGVRPQNFDVGYRPDGVRFAFDSKTLNDSDSVGKNWQNMVNDLATEATTVHSRFPHALVAFMFIVPKPCIGDARRLAITETLERLARREEVNGPAHMAEAVSFVLWDPTTGIIDPELPSSSSPPRIERFSTIVEAIYRSRYKGLPPHATD